MHQLNENHETPGFQEADEPGSDEGLGTKCCHCGMIRHVNIDGEPITGW